MTASNYLFRAKTHEGYIIKILVELLQQVVKVACLKIKSDGIYLQMPDSRKRILLDIKLNANNFNIFELVNEMQIGINLIHFHKMLKSIKKKDSFQFFITADNPDELQFFVHPQDNNRLAHSKIQIQKIQNMVMNLPGPYTHPVIIMSNEYQRTLKDMNNISNNIRVELRNHSFFLSSTANNIYSRKVQFGELDDESTVVYDEEFEMDAFMRILKIAGLSKSMHIYGSDKSNLPLKISSSIGQLGNISIYMKSKNQN